MGCGGKQEWGWDGSLVGRSTIHMFKRAEPMARVIRRTECDRAALTPLETLQRHAVTCADGAYIGPHSVGFMPEWAMQMSEATGKVVTAEVGTCCSVGASDSSSSNADSRPPGVGGNPDELSIRESVAFPRPIGRSDPGFTGKEIVALGASCEFHLLQAVGRDVDAVFPVTATFDNLLRDIRDHFVHGNWLYIRASATKLGKKPLALLAPRTDNFKVTLYARGFHKRFAYNYATVYLALSAKLTANRQNFKAQAWAGYERTMAKWEAGTSKKKKKPAPPGEDVGKRRSECVRLRQIGRVLVDPYVVIFGVGRGDLRDKFLMAYSTLAQSYKISALVKVQNQMEILASMRGAVRQILTLAMWLSTLSPVVHNRAMYPDRVPRSACLKLHVKVLSAHLVWRFLPTVVGLLPDLLVPVGEKRSMFGANARLVLSPFVDPSPKKVSDREAYRKKIQKANLPVYYWEQAIKALRELARWLRMEIIHLRRKLIAVQIPTGAPDRTDQKPFVGPDPEKTRPTTKKKAAEDSSSSSSDSSSSSSDTDVEDPVATWHMGDRKNAHEVVDATRTAVKSEALRQKDGGDPEPPPEPPPHEACDDEGIDGFETDDQEDPDINLVQVSGIASAPQKHQGDWAKLSRMCCPMLLKVKGRPQWCDTISPSRAFWEAAAEAFHPNVLAQPWIDTPPAAQSRQLEALSLVYHVMAPSLFMWTRTEFLNYERPPEELFQRIRLADIRQQYIKLRYDFLPPLLCSPEGKQCWSVSAVIVEMEEDHSLKFVGVDRVELESSSSAWGSDASIAFGCKSAVGKRVRVRLGRGKDGNPDYGSGVIRGFDDHLIEEKLYKLLMSRSYTQEVRPAGLWHVLRLYHRLIMAGVTSEALAECVGSMLTQRQQAQVGRHRHISECIGSTLLRCAGIAGDARDVGFIERALNVYFRRKPWHFLLTDRGRQLRHKNYPAGLLGSSVTVHRHILRSRVARRFSWLAGTLDEARDASARLHLKSESGSAVLETTRGVCALRSSRTLAEQRGKFDEMKAQYAPAQVDARVWDAEVMVSKQPLATLAPVRCPAR